MNPGQQTLPESNLDRVKKYGWSLLDKPGELRLLSKEALRVDHSYQRDQREKKTLQIASAWSWLAFGSLIVAHRSDDTYWVVDGQHRLEAAKKRRDVNLLPCVVFDVENVVAEAHGFLRSNANRKAPTSIEKYKAVVMTDDPCAVLVEKLVAEAGRTVSNSTGGTTVRCITQLTGYAKNKPEILQRVWPLIVQVTHGQCMHERVLCSLMYIEEHMPAGSSIVDRKWRERVLRVGYKDLLEAANRASAFYARGGPKVWATGVVQAMNKGCQVRLKISNSSEDEE